MENELIMAMTRYYERQPSRVQHFIKVYTFAKMIGEMEHLDFMTQKVLETAAIVHDIGIKVSEEKYGDSTGAHQETEGPDAARDMLAVLGYEKAVIERVCYLVGHHHTYDSIDGMDYQILVEADFLVNLYENERGINESAVRSALDRIFVTESGKALLTAMFLGVGDIQ